MKLGYIGNEVDLPRPQSVNVDYVELSKKVIMASGKTVKEIKRIKKILTITYDGLTTNVINLLLTLFESGKPVNYIYNDAGQAKSLEVYITSIPRDLYIPKPQYSKNIVITLEEV